MATKSQKYDVAHKLAADINTKMTAEFLAGIKYNMTPSSAFVELIDQAIEYTRYVSNEGKVIYIQFTTEIKGNCLRQINRLRDMGFRKHGQGMICSGFLNDLDANAALWVFIQNLTTTVETSTILYDSVIQKFISHVSKDDLPVRKITDSRSLEWLTWDELRMIETHFDLRRYLTEWDTWAPLDIIGDRPDVTFEQKGEVYIINLQSANSRTIVSDKPLTVCDILQGKSYKDIRIVIVVYYLFGFIGNTILYDKISSPTPLNTVDAFNEEIDKLQARNLSKDNLAKELILLSAKYLE